MSSRFPAGGACNASLYSLIKVMITIPFINNDLSLSLSLDLALTDTRLRIRKKRRTERGREVTWLGIASALALSLSLSRARSLYKAGNVRCYDRGRERERERERKKTFKKSIENCKHRLDSHTAVRVLSNRLHGSLPTATAGTAAAWQRFHSQRFRVRPRFFLRARRLLGRFLLR
jgi:hypothetical protein